MGFIPQVIAIVPNTVPQAQFCVPIFRHAFFAESLC